MCELVCVCVCVSVCVCEIFRHKIICSQPINIYDTIIFGGYPTQTIKDTHIIVLGINEMWKRIRNKIRPTPTSEDRHSFSGSIKSYSGSRVGDSRSFLDMISYHNFCPNRTKKFPKMPPDRSFGWIRRVLELRIAFRMKFSG